MRGVKLEREMACVAEATPATAARDMRALSSGFCIVGRLEGRIFRARGYAARDREGRLARSMAGECLDVCWV